MSYPTHILLEGDTLKDFIEMSGFFTTLDRWEGHKASYTLTAKRLFDDDLHTWRMFVDLFFPDKVPQLRKLNNGTFSLVPVFTYTRDGTFGLNEQMYTIEEVHALFDYLLIDPTIYNPVMDYIKDLHSHVRGRPAPPRLVPPSLPAFDRSRGSFDFSTNEDTNLASNKGTDNQPNLKLGFKNDEEEALYRKLPGKNYNRFARNGGKRRGRTTRKVHTRSSYSV